MTGKGKGARLERECEKILQHLGYVTHRARAVTYQRDGQWRRESTDVWGVFDILAWPAGYPGTARAVQVCAAKQVSPHKRKIDKWIARTGVALGGCIPTILLASRGDREEWRIDRRDSLEWCPMRHLEIKFSKARKALREANRKETTR